MGYILTGVAVLATMRMGSTIVLYLPFVLLYFFPSYYLLSYGTDLGRSLREADSTALTVALGHQKSFFKFWGVLMIVMLALCALLMVMTVTALVSKVSLVNKLLGH